VQQYHRYSERTGLHLKQAVIFLAYINAMGFLIKTQFRHNLARSRYPDSSCGEYRSALVCRMLIRSERISTVLQFFQVGSIVPVLIPVEVEVGVAQLNKHILYTTGYFASRIGKYQWDTGVQALQQNYFNSDTCPGCCQPGYFKITNGSVSSSRSARLLI